MHYILRRLRVLKTIPGTVNPRFRRKVWNARKFPDTKIQFLWVRRLALMRAGCYIEIQLSLDFARNLPINRQRRFILGKNLSALNKFDEVTSFIFYHLVFWDAYDENRQKNENRQEAMRK